MVTGTPGAGKSTTADALADCLHPVARVYTDELRHRVSPYAVPWQEPEGLEQLDLGIRSACAVARIYSAAGYHVVMNDVLSPAPRDRYAALWADLHLLTVLLRPSLPVAQRRAAARDKQVPVEIIAGLYEQMPTDAFELVIDNSQLSVAGVVQRVLSHLQRTETTN